MSSKRGSLAPASAYRAAGVNLDEGQKAVARIRELVRGTRTPRVESEIGAFAGFFSYPETGSDRLLVASMDGVGTKLKIAALAGKWHGVGVDIVSHCVNDILVHGATPIFFLDYVGAGRLSSEVVAEMVAGIADACRQAGCALLGGETAEMPGVYAPGECDLVGTIIGEVRRDELVDGSGIVPGDRLIGLRSQGLHTNGYSLARRVFHLDDNPRALEERVPGEEATLGEVLLRPHRMYLAAVLPLLRARLVRGMAHITGGGLVENLPRVLPANVRAVLERGWEIPPIFRLLQERGGIDFEECFRVFNMGVGYVLVTSASAAEEMLNRLREAGEDPIDLGWCEEGEPSVRWADPDERRPR